MRPLGYLYKRVAGRPEWLAATQVTDVYSLSGCVSKDFAYYINYWRHNGFWLFDSPSAIVSVAAEHSISLAGLKLFYYEVHEFQYDEDDRAWSAFEPDPAFETNVAVPAQKVLEGFDVTTFAAGTSPECSPLSCNGLAGSLSTNKHCLFGTFDEAKDALEKGDFRNSERGPYRIVAVYSVTQMELTSEMHRGNDSS